MFRKSFKKRILIDLDGVLNEHATYDQDSIPPIKDGAKEFLKKLNDKYDLVLFTSRNLKQAAKWLIDNDVDDYFSDVTNIKQPAIMIIDDRAIRFNGDYEEVLEQALDFKPYYVQ
jgi:trehalose-6-phosphatase